jgi:hypothetical protein
MITDVAVRANGNVFQDMRERPDASAFANRVGFHQRLLVNKCCFFHLEPIVDRIFKIFQDEHVNPAKIM